MWIILTTDDNEEEEPTDEKTEEKSKKQKPSKPIRIHAHHDDYIMLESCFLDNVPKFLVSDQIGKVSFIDNYTQPDGTIHVPITSLDEIGYIPYTFTADPYVTKDLLNTPVPIGQVISQELSLWRNLVEVRDDVRRELAVAYTNFSYTYYRYNSTSYLGYFGDTQTGKGRRGELFQRMGYRARATVDDSAPNVWQFIQDAGGLIIEDEVENWEKEDRQKLKIWRRGYTRGGKVSRLQLTNQGRKQLFFEIFGPKIVSGNKEFWDKALKERIIAEHTDFGLPKKSKIDKQDEDMMNRIRNGLLIYRLQHHRKELPVIQTPFVAREQELFEPLLQSCYQTALFDDLLTFFRWVSKDSTENRQKSNEGLITLACLRTYEGGEVKLTSRIIRDNLVEITSGKIANDEQGIPRAIRTGDEFNEREISVKRLGKALQFLFDAKPVRLTQDERGWILDPWRLLQEAQKYGFADKEMEKMELLKQQLQGTKVKQQ